MSSLERRNANTFTASASEPVRNKPSRLCSSALSAWRLSYFRLSAATGVMPGSEAYPHGRSWSRHALQAGRSPSH
jgi:hypothetical protein